MASEEKASVQERSAELAPAEFSVLRALCRTINAENSELKYKILDGVSKDGFTSRITKAIFTAVTEMFREGDFVVASELGDVLRREGVLSRQSTLHLDSFHLALLRLRQQALSVQRTNL